MEKEEEQFDGHLTRRSNEDDNINLALQSLKSGPEIDELMPVRHEAPQRVASENRLSEPRIYANFLGGKKINLDKKYIFKKVNGKMIRVE